MTLYRYKIVRGKRPVSDPLPRGIRQDTRWRTSHCLRPAEAIVTDFLKNPTEAAWKVFEREYLALLEQRYAKDPAPFRELAALASAQDVFLGCNCPTKKKPDLRHCHTFHALAFMHHKFPSLDVAFPPDAR